ncbi:hypothetical protein UG55_10145 [Frankia sp. EI5c]|uniref:hypothetical protein n=1 Tax=Frankia sp. EI5c TaxID=683316 RepID=UPI0007C2D73B|nr:hypothetical protein [Frankia sp. EI5c]OAA22245.1 hypothetical protein UG55_10513 [Frankia sp. EI5c]OAA26557.1 hypothetical protein UG55_10145 [Frankia sp. EI5c]
MPIFSSGGFGAWRTPGGGESPLIAARERGTGELVLTIRPGADVGDLVAVLGALPADAFFTEHFGDVNAVLVFRQVPGDSAGLPVAVDPSAGPAAASVPLP